METFAIGLGNLWWIRAFGRNPLVRRSDRIEALALCLAAVLTVVSIPIAGAIGTFVYEDRTRLYAEEVQNRHHVTAAAIEDGTVVMQQRSVSFTAPAAWSAAGRDYSDIVTWSGPVKAGDQQSIWVNSNGAKVEPPPSTSRAAADAVVIATNVLLGVAAASAGLVYAVRRGLDHRRHAQWDCELNASRQNDGRTNYQ